MPTDKAGRVIFVGNIPYGLSEEQVVHLFSTCGQVLNFRLVYDKDTGRPKGFGFAEFSDADAAASAVRNLNGHEIMGRTLRVDYSNEAGSGTEGQAQNTQQQSQQQQNISQQQHYQQFQQMHQHNPQPQTQSNDQPALNIPPGVTLPDNITAPDAISRTLRAMDPQQLLNVIVQLKDMVNSEPQRAQTLLVRSPQLSYAIFQALLLMGLVDTSVLSQVVEASSQQQSQQQQGSIPFQPLQTPYQPNTQPQQFQPPYQQQLAMGTPPVHNQPYPPPPPPPPVAQKPPQMTDQQWDFIRQLCNIPQQQIDAMPNPAERQSIMSIRQQYMPFFAGQFVGIHGY